jgi:hypothetical protein
MLGVQQCGYEGVGQRLTTRGKIHQSVIGSHRVYCSRKHIRPQYHADATAIGRIVYRSMFANPIVPDMLGI